MGKTLTKTVGEGDRVMNKTHPKTLERIVARLIPPPRDAKKCSAICTSGIAAPFNI
jgi:hypothetical protein